MDNEYILAIVLGTATALLILLVLFLLRKLFNGGAKTKYTFARNHKKQKTTGTPTIIPQNIPGFMLPTCRNVRVQEPLRKVSGLGDDPSSSDELDLDSLKPRNNNNVPVSTVITSAQTTFELGEVVSKMASVSPLKQSYPVLRGSISLQELNVYSPKPRSRQSLTNEQLVPSLKFALYYSVGTNELNVTVISVHNLIQLANLDSANLCVWVQVEFSRYHQEFRTKSCQASSGDSTFNETCVVSDFPVEHFSGSKISFRVLNDDTNVVAEAVYVVLGLPPCFPRNESVELQHPGIVHTSNTSRTGEMLICLKYDPVDEVVTLGIVECRDLRSSRKKNNKLLDTYVKVHVIFCNETVQKHRSKLVQKTNNPKFETRFNLAGFFSRAKMNQVRVKLTVVAKSVTKYRLGYVILGTAKTDDVTASGYQHWETIIDKPELDIVQWHALKPMRSLTP